MHITTRVLCSDTVVCRFGSTECVVMTPPRRLQTQIGTYINKIRALVEKKNRAIKDVDCDIKCLNRVRYSRL